MLIHAGIVLNLSVLGALFRPVKQNTSIIKEKDTNDHLDLEASVTHSWWSKHSQILCNTLFMSITVQAAIVWFAIIIFYVHIAAYLQYSGFTKDQAAVTMSVMGISNCVGRPIWGGLNQYHRFTAIMIYFICFLLTSVSVIVLPLVHSFTWIVLCATVFGLFSGSSSVLIPAIIVEALGLEHFSLAFGYHYTIISLVSVTGGPVAGKL